MKPTTKRQMKNEAKKRTLSAFFLAGLDCQFKKENTRSFIFVDLITKRIVRVRKSYLSKQELMNKLAKVRGCND